MIFCVFNVYLNVLNREKSLSEALLHNILPVPIANKLKTTTAAIADQFKGSTILFSDIVDFTPLSGQISPDELVKLLNEIFSEFDQLTDKHNLEKIKTIGDAYMVAAGIPELRDDHAEVSAEMALDMMKSLRVVNEKLGKKFQIRIGINSGPVVAGIIGKKKFAYDLWGDSVNIAARMESHGIPGEIQVSPDTYSLLRDKYVFEERGEIEVKGKGLIKTYLLKGKKQST